MLLEHSFLDTNLETSVVLTPSRAPARDGVRTRLSSLCDSLVPRLASFPGRKNERPGTHGTRFNAHARSINYSNRYTGTYAE